MAITKKVCYTFLLKPAALKEWGGTGAGTDSRTTIKISTILRTVVVDKFGEINWCNLMN